MRLDTWWSVWRAFASILPYCKLKDEKRGSAQVCDVCNLHCDNKLKDAYRLCQVVEAPDYCLLKEVKLSFRPRRCSGVVRDFQKTYSSGKDSEA